ncbi:cadherin domain-containing protein [Crocosphaera sp. XPORK-15E]|uniref:cadherin domain-containing protein n=1 Tax=Crocosphaera sp. XPORK-15E TaxID=3110247 RepID=UPI002B219BE3|nr:cadherin domain-containing protein [Crocosphaera sp. XPORK-15E]MEA5537307.1 cadherin domain-containing protein [Crocosphaera sp. XPORK-15E]
MAAGTYKPTTGTDRTASFTLKNNVGIYGGFAGTETARNQRDIATNATILSGEIGASGIADNAYHVVSATGTISNPLGNSSILDGFTVVGGNANGTTGNQGNGGGVYVSGASPTLQNITFRDNNGVNGGALYNESGSNPVLTDVLFEYNTATRGAAIYDDLSSPQITNGTFRLNTAINDGGAIYNTSSSNPTIVDSVFSRNSANTGSGGAIFSNLSNPNLINSTLSGNVAVTGGALHNVSSSVALRNSILWGNQDSSSTGNQVNNGSGGSVTVTNSIIQGGGFTGATNVDPLFVNAKADDLRLKSGSPALDAGDSTLLPLDSRDLDGDGNTSERIPLDLSRNTRVAGANVDLGAYEGAELAPAPTPAAIRTIFVRANAGGTNNGTSWVDAFTDLQGALAAAKSGDTIWVAGGTYKPTTGTDRTATFTLKNHVEIYGGFAGSETSLSQRNVATNATILSGDIGTVNTASDNVYHVVTGSNTSNTTILDGFTISGGNANGAGTNQNVGGGIFISDGSPILKNLIFENNNATNGGGLYNVSGANPLLTNITFRNNTATNGGAIFNTSSNSTLTDVTFTNNTVTSDGGAIYNASSTSTLTNATFTSNTASSGGAILNTSSNITLNNATFSSNISSSPNIGGGAIYSSGGSSTLNNATFSSNTATSDGGSIYNTGSNFTLKDVAFNNNTASSDGGAIFSTGGTFNLTDADFVQNRATAGLGGAVFLQTTGATITQADFLQNRSANGGAIYNNSNNVSVTNANFTLNIADAAGSVGGAIYNQNSNNLQVINAAFSRNNAASAGGAIYQSSDANAFITSTTNITNSSFSGNSAGSGSVVFSIGQNNVNNNLDRFYNTTIRNSIIWGNGGTAISDSTFSTTTATNSIIQGGQLGGTNVDPLFVDAINDDLRLQSTSPAINAGNNASLPADTRDLDGDSNITEAIPFDIARNPRVNGTNVDLGAFEFVQNSAPVLNDTTLTVPENSLLNTLVGTITATDADNNPLTYNITAGNPNLDGDGISAFTINNSGQIRVADPDDIDFEVNPNNPLTVSVSDGTLTDTAIITVNLTNVNETPNRPPVANDATFSLVKTSPINTTVGTVTASDPDNNPLTYSITAGNLDSDGDNIRAFSISNAGVITITDPDDISSQTNPFNLTVTVSDGDLNDTAAITVNLTNPPNRAPVVNDSVFSISKNSANGTVVGTINASDPDNNPLTYSITAGNLNTDGDTTPAFGISNTGVITVTDADDISTQTDPFNLTIQASDGSLTDTGLAAINLNNVNPVSFQLKLYEDNNGVVGSEITGNNAILGNSFFAEVRIGDIRTNAAGLIINSLDFGFAADVAQNINNFADIGNVNSPLITSNFPLFRGGTLDNTNGLIDNLSGGSVPQASQGTAIGINQLDRFSLLRFNVVGTRDNSNLTLTFDPTQIGFADGTFADPNGNLSLTRNIIINDAPIVSTINNVNLAERSAVGTVVVAGNLVEATDDAYGQTPTFSLSTSPKDGSGNDLFAINATTGEITLTQAGANTIDYESGVTSYNLGVKATDGFKLSTEKAFTVNITNVNEGTIVVDKNAITFGTKLSQYRTGATDSLFIRPNFADRTQFIDITNTAVGTDDVLAISGITINATNVTTNANFSNGDILLNPGETRRIALTYAPTAARQNFNVADGLVINSNAQNDSSLDVRLTGKSTFNSDISYDGTVNLSDLVTLQKPGLFGSKTGQTNYDPTADITGDGNINLAELVPLNAEFGLVV